MLSLILFLEAGALEMISRLKLLGCRLGDIWKWGGRNGEGSVKGYKVQYARWMSSRYHLYNLGPTIKYHTLT